MPFSSFGLTPTLTRAIQELGFSEPTAVQSLALAPALAGQDILGSAPTGSGKTAAFCLPLLQRLAAVPPARPRLTRGLVLAPTRELAAQIGQHLGQLGRHVSPALKIAVVFGGVSINPQMMNLRGGADIVVATPGRLLDLLDHNALKLDKVEVLVLDEADRLLDLGFADELQRLMALLPTDRQSLFFSATLPAPVQALARSVLRTPVRVEVLAAPEPERAVIQRAIQVARGKRTQLLKHLMTEHAWERVLVFVATKHAAEMVADKLRRAGINAEPFHGQLSQGKRTQVLMDFKASAVKVVVATDVAGRGLDIVQLPVVVNYDLPRSAVDYVHRIGRTGRAGEPGLAVSLIDEDSQAHFRLIEKRQGLAVPREQIAGFEPPPMAVTSLAAEGHDGRQSDPNGGIKGHRPSKKDKLRAQAALLPTPPEPEDDDEIKD